MGLVDSVRGAQDAMDRGDYRLATTASADGLAAYPSCLAAHRILGEAYLELGRTTPVIKHIEHTLSVDHLNVVARLGLGVASQEQKDYGAAYSHYLQAWEINSALDQVRDELVRLRGLFGVDDRLRPTRSGLAGIHARGSQLRRAAKEWRAVLVVEPESCRAQTSFAELLWRQGEDGLAPPGCRDALRGSPENARALAILADTERRLGDAGAEGFAEGYLGDRPLGASLVGLAERSTRRIGAGSALSTSIVANDGMVTVRNAGSFALAILSEHVHASLVVGASHHAVTEITSILNPT